jgi:hypothetical protein
MAVVMGLAYGGVVSAQTPPSTPARGIIDCVPQQRPFDAANVDLTGTWRDQGDGVYYVSQYGDTVWWSAMSGLGGPADLAGRNWSNVAKGSLDADNVLMIEWADVPRAHHTATGTVWAQAEAGAQGELQLSLIRDTGGSGVSRWTTCSIVGGPDPATPPPIGAYEADLSKADLIAAGAWPEDAALLGTGTTTLTFAEDGTFAFEADWVAEGGCGGSYDVVGRVVRLTFTPSGVCGGVDDIQTELTDEGLSITWIDCGPTFCNHASDRALFERLWVPAS